MSDTVIHVRELEKRYRVWTHARPTNLKERLHIAGATMRARAKLGETTAYRQDVQALRGVSFDVPRGEILGVIGRNGAGKSTLLSILARITEPTGGYAELRGRVSSLLEVGTGFHPELSGRDNVFLNGAILGMKRSETSARFDEIVEFSGVGEFIDIPVKRYSSGMQVRLAFAVAAHLDPEILLLDEVLAVGDAAFQARCHARVREMTAGGRTVLFVSHDVTSVERLCKHAIVLDGGLITYEGVAADAVDHYRMTTRAEVELDKTTPTRQGTGEMRVRRLAVNSGSDDGVPRTGSRFQIEVELRPERGRELDGVRINLGINTPEGAQLVFLSTDLDALGPIRTMSGDLTLYCDVESLPLKPATYVVSASLTRGETLIDYWHAAAHVSLLASERFPPPTAAGGAPVVVGQSWHLSGESVVQVPSPAAASEAL